MQHEVNLQRDVTDKRGCLKFQLTRTRADIVQFKIINFECKFIFRAADW